MKTFFHLIQEVQERGLCHHCGGCVTFCTAVNYGALELGPDGRPQYRDRDKCIDCGLCYMICPEIHDLDEEQKRLVSWSAPMGRILDASIARAKDPAVRERATDGGVVTALLLHLFDMGFINGAIVTRQVRPFQREPWLALARDEILDAAGFHFDTSHGMPLFGEAYSTYAPSVHELRAMVRRGVNRIAFVGTPCQINTVRRMETLGIVPADAIKYHLGLFCAGNFAFGDEQRRHLEELGSFQWETVSRINVKQELRIHLASGETRKIPLPQLDFMKRFACRFCGDYSAEYADLSFGGIGAEEGWTTVLVRTPVGRALWATARGEAIEPYRAADGQPNPARQVLDTVQQGSDKKKESAGLSRRHAEL
jgi:coenzyme F420 hydrogenase subunit beta